jgi:hypothetical protein
MLSINTDYIKEIQKLHQVDKKINIAILLSGRIIYYEHFYETIIERLCLNDNYNIKVFFSINTISFDKNTDINEEISKVKKVFGKTFGDLRYENYKLPYSFSKHHLHHGSKLYTFPNNMYNIFSLFYNDKKNLELINTYETANNMSFDILCKIRTEFMLLGPLFQFTVDKKNDTILRYSHIQEVRYWGHRYPNLPFRMLGDTFVYGNKKSMTIYCSTYDWMCEQNRKMNGNYFHGGEILLTDSVLRYAFYDIPGGGQEPRLSEAEIIEKYTNNPNHLKLIYLDDVKHFLHQSLNGKEKNANTVKLTPYTILDYTNPDITS